MQDYRKLKVWQRGHELTLDIYRATRSFPVDERFALTSQMRRAAFSVPSNIAEGCGRGSDRELLRFLQIASGSNHELEYFIILSRDLGSLAEEAARKLLADASEVRQMLAGLDRAVRGGEASGSRSE